MWSTVAISLAARTGCTVGTCTVAKIPIRSVAAARPAAQVSVSKLRWLKLVAPPKPRQRATGTSASIPAASAARAILTDSSHSILSVSAALVIEQPPLTLSPKTPSLRRLGLLAIGLLETIAPTYAPARASLSNQFGVATHLKCQPGGLICSRCRARRTGHGGRYSDGRNDQSESRADQCRCVSALRPDA